MIDLKTYRVLVPYCIFKTRDDLKTNGIVKRVYSWTNRNLNKPILSDSRQSDDMVMILLNWFEDKSKYGVKDFKFIDTKSGKSMNTSGISDLEFAFHGYFEIRENFRMIVDFHNDIKESKQIIVLNDSKTIFFARQK